MPRNQRRCKSTSAKNKNGQADGKSKIRIGNNLLKRKAVAVDLNLKSNDCTELHIAVQNNNIKMVKYLVSKGADIHAEDDLGRKPIHHAAREGFIDIVQFFLSKQMTVDERCSKVKRTLLHFSTILDQLPMQAFLISNGASIDPLDIDGCSPLHLASRFGHFDTVQHLLKKGAMYNTVDDFGATPFDDSCNVMIREVLKATNELNEAVKTNDLLKLRNCIRLGASLNPKSICGFPALHVAAMKGFVEITKMLLICKADPNALGSRNDYTPLHYAAWRGFEEISEILLLCNANPNAPGKDGLTPLHYAALYSHLETVKLLLVNGAIYNAVTVIGCRPIDCAENGDVINLLITIDETFKNVKKKDVKVVDDIFKLESGMKAVVMCAHNENDETLLEVARGSGYPKLKELSAICNSDPFLYLKKKFRNFGFKEFYFLEQKN